MSALDKIIEGISRQAGEKADGILNEANQKAAEILENGKSDRAKLEQQTENTVNRECREIEKRAQSANRLSRKLALLQTRNQVIGEVIAEAKAKLTNEADQERFNIVWQGDILLNNSIDAIFEAEEQTLRDRAYSVLTAEA